MLLIKSNNFVTSSNLCYNKEGFSWTNSVQDTSIYADPGVRSLKEMGLIFGEEFSDLIPENYKNSAALLKTSPPWGLYIGGAKFKSLINKQVEAYESLLENHEKLDVEFHAKINSFIDSLKPAKFNTALLTSDMRSHKHFERIVAPNMLDGKMMRPTYARTKTKTGRLSVIDGPNVLTMHSDLRKGVVDGYSIDFVSIEPNVLLVDQGRSPRTDIYDQIRQEVFDGKQSRAKVKIAVMSALYGSGRKDNFAGKVEDYFQVNQQIEKLAAKVKDDTIRNKFGRLINLDGATGKHLLALWLQSTAADAALYGFYNFSKEVDISPYWIIHDGLIFIYNDKQKHVTHLDAGLETRLPVKVEKL